MVSWVCTPPGTALAVRVLHFPLQPRLFFMSVSDSCLTWLLKVIICQKQVIRLTGCESYVGKVTAYLACREFQSWCAGRNVFFIAPPTHLPEAFQPGLGCFHSASQLLKKHSLSQHWLGKARSDPRLITLLVLSILWV